MRVLLQSKPSAARAAATARSSLSTGAEPVHLSLDAREGRHHPGLDLADAEVARVPRGAGGVGVDENHAERQRVVQRGDGVAAFVLGCAAWCGFGHVSARLPTPSANPR